MPSNAGSPRIGERTAQPLLPVSPSQKSNSSTKSPYSFSHISQVPRGLLPWSTLFSTFHTAPASAGLLTSSQRRTTQPSGMPSLGKSGTNAGDSPARATTAPAKTMTNEVTALNNRLFIGRRFYCRLVLTASWSPWEIARVETAWPKRRRAGKQFPARECVQLLFS